MSNEVDFNFKMHSFGQKYAKAHIIDCVSVSCTWYKSLFLAAQKKKSAATRETLTDKSQNNSGWKSAVDTVVALSSLFCNGIPSLIEPNASM